MGTTLVIAPAALISNLGEIDNGKDTAQNVVFASMKLGETPKIPSMAKSNWPSLKTFVVKILTSEAQRLPKMFQYRLHHCTTPMNPMSPAHPVIGTPLSIARTLMTMTTLLRLSMSQWTLTTAMMTLLEMCPTML